MAYTFDGSDRIISVDTAPVAGEMTLYTDEMYAYWKQWVHDGTGAGYFPAFRSSGGEFTAEDQARGSWYFLINQWRFRPYAADHRLVINGNLRVTSDNTEDSTAAGSPFTYPAGNYAIHIETEFSTQSLKQIVSGASVLQADEREQLMAIPTEKIIEMYQIAGLDITAPMTVTPSSRVAGDISLAITGDGSTSTTVTRE
jgi:hypothetical protein